MTGRGCDDIFLYSQQQKLYLWGYVQRCERRYGLDNFHFTRLDIAIDDKNEKPFFYHREQIKKKCEKEEFISIVRATTLMKASLTISTPQKRFISVLKIGIVLPLYDKDKEVCSKYNKTLDEVGS